MKTETVRSGGISAILKEQLKETLLLAFHIRMTEAHFRGRNIEVMDLLNAMSLEVRTLSDLLNRISVARGNTPTRLTDTQPPRTHADGGLDSLLNLFCRYDRDTSERLATVRRSHDRETMALFDRILSMTSRSIWFLDIYSNAVGLRHRLSRLPKWKHVPVVRQLAG